MCRVLGVLRSGYYHYEKNPMSLEDRRRHEEMLDHVEWIAEASKHSYGSRRMKVALNCLGYPVSRHKARKLMREAGVQVRRRKKYKVTTNSNHKQPVYDNLLQRQFDVAQIDQVYAADITYVWTQEGWLLTRQHNNEHFLGCIGNLIVPKIRLHSISLSLDRSHMLVQFYFHFSLFSRRLVGTDLGL